MGSFIDTATNQLSGVTHARYFVTCQLIVMSFSLTALADMSGDSKGDLAGWDQKSGAITVWTSTGSGLGRSFSFGVLGMNMKIYFADVDGDQKTDLIGWNQNSGAITVWTSTGSGLGRSFSFGVLGMNMKIHFADVDGDQKADLIGWDQNSGEITVWPSSGSGLSSSFAFGTLPASWFKIYFADTNGDGKSDLIGWDGSSGAITVWTSTGLGLGTSFAFGALPANQFKIYLSDTNGDGKRDLIGWNQSSGSITVWTSTGSGLGSSFPFGVLPASAFEIQVPDVHRLMAPVGMGYCQSETLCVHNLMPLWSQMDSTTFPVNDGSVPLLQYVNQQTGANLTSERGWCGGVAAGMVLKAYANELFNAEIELPNYTYLNSNDSTTLIWNTFSVVKTNVVNGGTSFSNINQGIINVVNGTIGNASSRVTLYDLGTDFRQTRPIVIAGVSAPAPGGKTYQHQIAINGKDGVFYKVFDPWGSVYNVSFSAYNAPIGTMATYALSYASGSTFGFTSYYPGTYILPNATVAIKNYGALPDVTAAPLVSGSLFNGDLYGIIVSPSGVSSRWDSTMVYGKDTPTAATTYLYQVPMSNGTWTLTNAAKPPVNLTAGGGNKQIGPATIAPFEFIANVPFYH